MNRDCRIFQDVTVPEVVKQILRQHKIDSFRESLFRSYRHWDCVTQYRESDFEFISRILAQEGIYYYFRHEEAKHTMVLADSIGGHETAEGYETVPYTPEERRRPQANRRPRQRTRAAEEVVDHGRFWRSTWPSFSPT